MAYDIVALALARRGAATARDTMRRHTSRSEGRDQADMAMGSAARISTITWPLVES